MIAHRSTTSNQRLHIVEPRLLGRVGFQHLQVPLPVRNSTGRFAVEAGANGGAVVVLEAAFDALDPAGSVSSANVQQRVSLS